MPLLSPFPDVPIPQVNLLDYLFGRPHDVTDTRPLWIDYKDSTKSLSARQAVEWICRVGAGLDGLGLGRGDVVMMCSTNHVLLPVAYLGILGATCIFTGINPTYTVKEIAHQISDAQPKVLLVHPSKLQDVLDAAARSGFPRDRIFRFSDDALSSCHVVAARPDEAGVRDWTAILPPAPSSWSWPALAPHEARAVPASINYSSGTTGLPKGVCVSHANLIANMQQIIGCSHPSELRRPSASSSPATSPRDVSVAFLPLYHAFGQMYTILLAARRRSPVYLMPAFRFGEFLAAAARHRATTMLLVPPVAVMLAKRADEVAAHDLSSVREVLCGAAPLRGDLQSEVARRLGVEVRQAWGMTELTCAAAMMPPAGTIGGGGGGGRKVGGADEAGSCGVLVPNMQARLLDDDGNEVVGFGEPGEVFVRGPNVMLGYWRNERATRETIDSDGWLRSGDVAVCNEDGLFWIVDRKKELIKVNGLQVAPAELEALLLENEHVADAAVVGITLNNEEYPRAYVHIRDASGSKIRPRDVQDWVAARVAKHKRLVGGVCFVDAVPKLASGKIVRKLLREWAKRDAAEMERAGWTRSKM